MKMNLRCQTILVFCFVMSAANKDYDNKLTKLWSLSSASNSDGSAVVNVTSASIVIQPSGYNTRHVSAKTRDNSRVPYKSYAFKPRAIPLRKDEQQSQVERNVYYSQDNVKKYKSEILFPGNYNPIAKEKSNENLTKEIVYQSESPFRPKAIPLIRGYEYQQRSLDVDEEPIIEKPEGFPEQIASRRSISTLLGVDDDDDDNDNDNDNEEEEEGEDEEEEPIDGQTEKERKSKHKKKIKAKKLKKYMLPLLMAYKLKYFALVPVMIGGLVLLVGATGLAGFFFALFAAVMGLQKGGY